MKINDWVRLRNSDSGERGQVVAFGVERAEDAGWGAKWVYVRWRSGVRRHEVGEVELCPQ